MIVKGVSRFDRQYFGQVLQFLHATLASNVGVSSDTLFIVGGVVGQASDVRSTASTPGQVTTLRNLSPLSPSA